MSRHVIEVEMPRQTPVNVPLLRKTLEHIEAHPEEWNQNTFRNDCGTAMCFAGHAAILAGAKWVADDPYSWGHQRVIFQDKGMHVHDAAQAALGLSDHDAWDLFYGGNRIEDVRAIIAELSEGSEPC